MGLDSIAQSAGVALAISLVLVLAFIRGDIVSGETYRQLERAFDREQDLYEKRVQSIETLGRAVEKLTASVEAVLRDRRGY